MKTKVGLPSGRERAGEEDSSEVERTKRVSVETEKRRETERERSRRGWILFGVPGYGEGRTTRRLKTQRGRGRRAGGEEGRDREGKRMRGRRRRVDVEREKVQTAISLRTKV